MPTRRIFPESESTSNSPNDSTRRILPPKPSSAKPFYAAQKAPSAFSLKDPRPYEQQEWWIEQDKKWQEASKISAAKKSSPTIKYYSRRTSLTPTDSIRLAATRDDSYDKQRLLSSAIAAEQLETVQLVIYQRVSFDTSFNIRALMVPRSSYSEEYAKANPHDTSPLGAACYIGNYEMVEFFLKIGHPLTGKEISSTFKGMHPDFEYSSYQNNILKLLLLSGANITPKELEYANRHCPKDIAQLLHNYIDNPILVKKQLQREYESGALTPDSPECCCCIQ